MTTLPVLVADEDRVFFRSISEALQTGPYAVDFAQSGGVALEACATKLYEIVIVDSGLDGDGGVDLVSAMAERLPGADFLVMSGYGSPRSEMSVGSRPTIGFLSKPLEPDRLRGIAARIAERRSLARENARLQGRIEELEARDAAERRQGEERLRGAEWRYRYLFDQAPVMYVICRGSREEPVIVDCNRAWLTTLGYSRDEVIGMPLAKLYTERSRGELLRADAGEAAAVGSGYAECQLMTREGKVLETLTSTVPDIDIEGRVVGTRATYVDITDFKRAESRLRESEEKYRSLFEDSRDTIYVTNEYGEVLDVNPAGVELFGFDRREELQALNARDFYAEPESRDRIVAELQERGFVKDAEIVLRKRDGTEFEALATTVAMRDPATGALTFRGILRDITERKRLERIVHRSHRMEAVGRLSGGIAHDFSNLLTSIKIYASLALKRCLPGSELYHDLRQVAETTDHAAGLVNQLLAFSRQQLLRPKVLSLNDVVANLEQILRRTIGEDVRLELELDRELGMVEADPVQMEQVVMNLVLNARDAMPSGGRIVIRTENVELSERAEREAYELAGSCVRLSVSDSGGGMDEETLARVFDPFFTTKEQGKGTGLGLATVYGIVKQSGGGILVDSRPEEGARFSIALPRVMPEVAVTVARQSEEVPEARAGGERVLVVEDEEILRLVVGRALAERGYDVMLAGDAEQALEMLGESEHPIDLLLSDVVLPGMDGRDLAERAQRLCPGMQVIWMTGYVDRPLTEGGRWVSPDRVLRKPFNLTEMEQRVRKVLDGGAS